MNKNIAMCDAYTHADPCHFKIRVDMPTPVTV